MTALKVCAFGCFDRGFDRSWILLEALEGEGARVEYCHRDVWASERHKTRLFPWRWVLLALRYALALVALAFRLLRSAPADVLYVGYMGHVDLVVAYCLNWRRATLVFDPCISLFNTLVDDRGLLKPGGIGARIVRQLDVLPCRLADVVLVDTAAHGRYFHDALGVAEGKIHRVFVGAGTDFQAAVWSPIGEPFHAFFFAKFAPLHGVETILDAARRLRHDDIRFTIVGGGQLEATVRNELAAHDLPNVEWIPWLERGALIDRMRQADVCLGIFGVTTKAAMVIPNKVFQAIAAGIPVITRDGPAVRELLEDGRSVTLCEAGNGAALAAAIVDAKMHRTESAVRGRQGRQAFVDRASHAAIAAQFLEAVHAR